GACDGVWVGEHTAGILGRAWVRGPPSRRNLGAFSTWLLSIARNVAVDHWRSHREHVPLEDAAQIAGGERPDELAERRSDEARLGALLATLPQRERELIALKYGAGLTNRAIARRHG